jgi:hypothetical protein
MLARDEGNRDEDDEGHQVVVVGATPRRHIHVRLDDELGDDRICGVCDSVGKYPSHIAHFKALVAHDISDSAQHYQ